MKIPVKTPEETAEKRFKRMASIESAEHFPVKLRNDLFPSSPDSLCSVTQERTNNKAQELPLTKELWCSFNNYCTNLGENCPTNRDWNSVLVSWAVLSHPSKAYTLLTQYFISCQAEYQSKIWNLFYLNIIMTEILQNICLYKKVIVDQQW